MRLPICFLFVIFCLPAIESNGKQEGPSYCNTICYNDVHKCVANNTLIIDLRTKQEVMDTGLIPTSINIPLSRLTAKMALSKTDFKDEFFHVKPKKRDMIIVTGRSNARNADAAQLLSCLGYNKIFDYVGGYNEWEKKINALPPPSCDKCGDPKPQSKCESCE